MDKSAGAWVITGARGACRLAGVNFLERCNQIRLARSLEIEAAVKFVVVLVRDPNRKSALHCRGPRQRPTVQNFSGEAFIFRYRQIPVVTEHKSMPGVE